MEEFTPTIVKVTYLPEKYWSGENVSDAVILPPIKVTTIPYTVEGKNITVGAKNKVKVSYTETTDNHKGLSVTLGQSDKVYGGGSRALPHNRRGYAFMLDNNPWYGYSNGADNLNFSVPFFYFLCWIRIVF